MNSQIIGISKKSLIIKAKKLGIKDPHKLSTKKLLNKVNRHNISKKVTQLLRKKIGERANITKSDLDKALELYSLSSSDLKNLAKLQRIKNLSELTKDDLIYTLLRSEKVLQENNYLKYINNATNSNLRDRINHARMMTAKLGNILTNIERHKIRKELYDMENTKYTKASRERAVIRLAELTNDLYYKQKQHSSRHHDQTYFGTKDIEHLYNDKIDYYYEPILIRSSFENNFEEYEMRGDKWKNLSLKEYLAVIMPQLTELIDKKKEKHTR